MILSRSVRCFFPKAFKAKAGIHEAIVPVGKAAHASVLPVNPAPNINETHSSYSARHQR
jgi:hypothetical protein